MRLPLKAKILLPMVLGALLLGLSAGVVSYFGLKHVTDERYESDFANRIATIRSFLAAQQKELDATGMAEAYDEQFRKNALAALRAQYYKEGAAGSSYPFIRDAKGVVVMHPVMKAGDTTGSDADYVRFMLTAKQGTQIYTFKGEPKWMIFDTDPRWGWTLGFGVSMEEKYGDLRSILTQLGVVLGALLLLVLVVTVWAVTRSVTRPLGAIATHLRQGDGAALPPALLARRDELGLLAQALDRSQAAAKQAQEEQRAHAARAEETIRRRLDEVLGEVAGHSDTLKGTSGTVASAATEVSSSVNTVAASTEELAASVKEIARNTSEAARIAGEAASMAGKMDTVMARLADSNQKIGAVVQTIQGIAGQTNLLALNATIEAARAGEAGRGFAVVASEVKDLARQTATATGDIAGKIAAVQGDAAAVAEAIKQITATITSINQIQQTVASAVEEQSATTDEMSRNVGEAARGSAAIAQQVNELAELAAKLQELVRR